MKKDGNKIQSNEDEQNTEHYGTTVIRREYIQTGRLAAVVQRQINIFVIIQAVILQQKNLVNDKPVAAHLKMNERGKAIVVKLNCQRFEFVGRARDLIFIAVDHFAVINNASPTPSVG